MDTAAASPQTRSLQSGLMMTAWVVTLLVSSLPNILIQELAGIPTGWLFWAKLGLLALLLAASLAWTQIRPLRAYFIVVAVLYLFEYGSTWLGGTALWHSWFGNGGGPFRQAMLSNQLLRLAVALPMIAVLFLLKKKAGAFFLVKGNMQATAEPIPGLMTQPTPWSRLGLVLSLAISSGTLVFLVLAGTPTRVMLARALPILPFVLLFALMNSFSEELNYRAGFLSVLEGPVGKQSALLMTAAFFGIGHFYGVPYGVVGVVLASILGWFLGKSMLETRGFAWAWIIHFLQDVLIFSFMAIGSVVPGG